MNPHFSGHKYSGEKSLMTNSGRTRVGSVVFYTSPKIDIIHGMVRIHYQFDFSSLNDSVQRRLKFSNGSREVWFQGLSNYEIEKDALHLFGNDYTIE